MPILNVKISQPASAALTQAISETLLELTTRILRKKRELTAMTLTHVPPEQWVVGGSTLAAQGKNSFYFDIKVVDGTNTKDEKAQYIAECFAAFGQLLAPLHEESYIHVQDVRAEAYGFGGLTQEYRYIKAKP
ncbi:MAG: 4-oxalocrotonate tautomerase [Pseudomonadota bacterium]